jgi:hypothetical protein
MRSARLRGCPKRRFRATTQRDRSRIFLNRPLKQGKTNVPSTDSLSYPTKQLLSYRICQQVAV